MSEEELWLARIQMNLRHPGVRRDLRQVESLHRTVMSLFPDIDSEAARAALGALHRVDMVREKPVLLVQSGCMPDFARLDPRYGETALVSLRSLFTTLRPGAIVRYRLLVNATKRPAAGPMAGKRVALGERETLKWWTARAPSLGLILNTEPGAIKDSLFGGASNGVRVTLRPWRLDGVASVDDLDQLEAGVRAGVGRGRAFGCGLLSLSPVRNGSQ